MTARWQWMAVAAIASVSMATHLPARAHSASDAYLTLDAGTRAAGSETVVHGQWDIALRDLHFVLGLDDDGDGTITWRELRRHQPAIARHAYGFLQAQADGKACTVRPKGQKVANHADGAYAALSFDIVCTGAPARLTLDYRMFFAIDPSHRCILVFQSGGETATALLSPQNSKVDFRLRPAVGPRSAGGPTERSSVGLASTGARPQW